MAAAIMAMPAFWQAAGQVGAAAVTPQPNVSSTGPTVISPTFGSFDVVAGGKGSTGGTRAAGATSDLQPVGAQTWSTVALVAGLVLVALIIRRK